MKLVSEESRTSSGGDYGVSTAAMHARGTAFSPELYPRGSTMSASESFTFMKRSRRTGSVLESLYEMVATRSADRVAFAARLPCSMWTASAPLLVAQGRGPARQHQRSNQIVDALRKRGIDVQYIVKENEGHGFQNEENASSSTGDGEVPRGHVNPRERSRCCNDRRSAGGTSTAAVRRAEERVDRPCAMASSTARALPRRARRGEVVALERDGRRRESRSVRRSGPDSRPSSTRMRQGLSFGA